MMGEMLGGLRFPMSIKEDNESKHLTCNSETWRDGEPLKSKSNKLGIVAHACNPSSQETGTGGLQDQGQPGLHSETMIRKKGGREKIAPLYSGYTKTTSVSYSKSSQIAEAEQVENVPGHPLSLPLVEKPVLRTQPWQEALPLALAFPWCASRQSP
jgi:hypothetical protein